MSGRGHARASSPGSSSRCGPRGRRSRRSAGSSTRCSRTPIRIEVPGPCVDVVGHRRRPAAHREHLDDGGDRRRRRRPPGRQARQPCGVLLLRGGRRARGARRPARPAAGSGWPSSPSEVGITFCFAQVFHPSFRHAAVGPPRARRPHGVQLPRPADEPGAAAAPPRSASPTRRMASDRRGGARRPAAPPPWSSAARTASTSCPRRPRRRSGWSRDGTVTETTARPRARSGCPRATLEDLRGGDAAHNAGCRPRRCWPARPGPVRDAVLLNAAAALVAVDGLGDPAPAKVVSDDLDRPVADRVRGRRRCRRLGRRGGRSRPLGRGDPGLSRAGARPRRVGRQLVEAEGERGVEVVPGVGAEGEVRLRRPDAGHLAQPVGDDVGELLVLADADDRRRGRRRRSRSRPR